MPHRQGICRITTGIAAALIDDGRILSACITNMGSGGVFLVAECPQPVDCEFVLRFSLPGDAEILSVKARVVWSKTRTASSPAGMGVEFINMSHEHRRKIESFIQTRQLLQQMHA